MLVLSCCRLPSAQATDHSSLLDQAQPFDDNAPQQPGKQGVAKKKAKQAVRRRLTDITNSAAALGTKLAREFAATGSKGCTAASVPDMVTFWEQRAKMQL